MTHRCTADVSDVVAGSLLLANGTSVLQVSNPFARDVDEKSVQEAYRVVAGDTITGAITGDVSRLTNISSIRAVGIRRFTSLRALFLSF